LGRGASDAARRTTRSTPGPAITMMSAPVVVVIAHGRVEDVPHVSIETQNQAFSAATLIADIVGNHHAHLRAQLPRIESVAADIVTYGDAGDPILAEIRQLVGGLRACVESQLDKEEKLLFPMLARLEEQTVVSKCHAGMIRSRLVMAERDAARIRGVLARLRDLAMEHLSPAGGCEACHELIAVLDDLAADLKEHTRKECDVLFPWAVRREMELAR
jgi:regulator of cell morphogenesis and NO signaling